MNFSHDYVVQMLHEARVADVKLAADRRRLVRDALNAKKQLARLTAPALPFRSTAAGQSAARSHDAAKHGREAA
jgi:hypothetical protein